VVAIVLLSWCACMRLASNLAHCDMTNLLMWHVAVSHSGFMRSGASSAQAWRISFTTAATAQRFEGSGVLEYICMWPPG
jgi:hypothetical protein